MTYEHSHDQNICILLVEDNPVDARRFEFLLSKTQNYYQLKKAETLTSALKILGESSIQVVLLDLTLPDSKGVQTVHTLHSNYPFVPIVVLTGIEDEQVMDEAATAGAQDYLVKQELTATNLWRVLRYAMERQSHEEALRASRRAYQRQAEELDLLNRIISATATSIDEQAILDVVCFNLVHFYHVERVLILDYQPELGTVTVRADYSQALPSLPLTTHSLDNFDELTAALITQQTLMCPSLSGNLQTYLNVLPNSQAILRALSIEGNTIGFFVLLLPKKHAMAEQDLKLVNMVADEIELGLTNVGLYSRLQSHAEKLEAHVKERTQELAAANKKLQSLDKLKSKFVSDVSHELRNPVTNLGLFLDLLEFAKEEKQAQYISILRNQVRRLSTLIEEILSLSRLENGKVSRSFRPVNINDLVKQVFESHLPRAQNKQISLQFNPTIQLPLAWGNPDQLTQVITNLLDNALNYTPEGNIIITTGPAPSSNGTERLLLQISDSGMGISEEDLPHIFERFYRGSQIGMKKMAGTGLGLGIVNEIIELHNGRIEVSSSNQNGTTFTVTLPTSPQD